ncbi:hypothetical protein NAP1_10243 [Erythrobacter sp. NAP1]|uniref:MBL fold metallo-hydrolase n=1 Tax=Erythrobacter sp. NAP1 TaxID=237727 RepID=UPI000068789D|nr:MBL fold metallo-hydrolase [Erythrobacter sp. NAP1]EAQ27966.1 hypothetical protein NAP1_10243 [Erythrobacter sp. NAP1]
MALPSCAEAPNDTVAPPTELATGPNPNTATAILNAGVMAELGGDLERGDTAGTRPVKLLFDPLYDDHWGTFEVPPPELVEALVTGAPPYDGVAAVFVSHAHGDHFSEEQLTAMLAAQADLVMVAPAQALDRMREAPGWDEALAERIRTIELANGEAAEAIAIAGATIEAFRSPHSGWPDRHAEVHNITFRVSAPAGEGLSARVMHLGDADPASEHYEALTAFLQARRTSLAMVPYWHYAQGGFDALLDETFNAHAAVAMHVPIEAPGYLARGERPFFTEVGQMVEIVPVE